MTGFYGMMIFLGIVLIAIGFIILKFPDFEWKLSISRRLFLRGGEPTELYYSCQRISAIVYIIFGFLLVIWSITSSIDYSKGYELKIDNQDISLPCSYSDIEAIGFKLSPDEKTKTIGGPNDKNETHTFDVKNDAGKQFKISLKNESDESKPVTECTVVGICVYTEEGPVVELHNGVRNTMKQAQIEEKMGNSYQVMPSGTSKKYKYNKNFKYFDIIIAYGNNSASYDYTNIYNVVNDNINVEFIRIEKK